MQSRQVGHRAELEEAIAAATPGCGGLQYAPGFLRRLDHWESEAHAFESFFQVLETISVAGSTT